MRIVDRLTERQVKNAKPGKDRFVKRLLDGNGLYLQATRSKTGGINRNWVFRYELDGQRRDMGLGSLHDVGLAAARQKAKELREQLVLDGVDPLEARNQEREERRARAQSARAEKAKAQTFRQCTEKYLDIHGDKWKNAKHAAQWRATLETYAYPVIGDLDVANIDEGHLIRILQPIWKTIPETARRVRGRIESVIGYATVSKFRTGDNPARWRNHLQALLGGTQKAGEHHPALPFGEAPAFMAELRRQDGIAARALELTILTAARTGDVVGGDRDGKPPMLRSHLDLNAKVWTIPSTKTEAEHRVPLTDAAIDLLKFVMKKYPTKAVIFPGSKPRRPAKSWHGEHRLSNMAMTEVIKRLNKKRAARGEPLFVDPKQGDARITVHGFRSSFRDWAGDRTSFARDVVEMALAHTIKDKTEAAYRRSDALEKRRKLLEAWTAFLAKPMPAEGGNVVRIKRG
jgi:integrase